MEVFPKQDRVIVEIRGWGLFLASGYLGFDLLKNCFGKRRIGGKKLFQRKSGTGLKVPCIGQARCGAVCAAQILVPVGVQADDAVPVTGGLVLGQELVTVKRRLVIRDIFCIIRGLWKQDCAAVLLCFTCILRIILIDRPRCCNVVCGVETGIADFVLKDGDTS